MLKSSSNKIELMDSLKELLPVLSKNSENLVRFFEISDSLDHSLSLDSFFPEIKFTQLFFQI
jgi:hypothetical protein